MAKDLKMNPRIRSVLIAMIGGMMAVSYLASRGIVDLSFGFPKGGLAEGIIMVISGALAGYAVLLAFRVLRSAMERLKK